jgi:hypothetical protein
MADQINSAIPSVYHVKLLGQGFECPLLVRRGFRRKDAAARLVGDSSSRRMKRMVQQEEVNVCNRSEIFRCLIALRRWGIVLASTPCNFPLVESDDARS